MNKSDIPILRKIAFHKRQIQFYIDTLKVKRVIETALKHSPEIFVLPEIKIDDVSEPMMIYPHKEPYKSDI